MLIYTPEFLISGYVMVKPTKIGDRKDYSKRVSDILAAASERMSYSGEPDFLELTNNLHFIVTSLLGGEIDKLILVHEGKEEMEQFQFYTKDEVIFFVFGVFPDNKGKWLTKQMAKYFSELVKGKDIDDLSKSDKTNIAIEFKMLAKLIIKQCNKLGERIPEREIPSTRGNIKINYLGLSSMAIGVISLLIEKENLNCESLNELNNVELDNDMIESIFTSKIEAIVANTIGITNTIPRLISVKLGPQRYQFITFKKYQNNYLLSLISEGNLNKLEEVEEMLDLYLTPIVVNAFTGNLKPFDEAKIILREVFEIINRKLNSLYD